MTATRSAPITEAEIDRLVQDRWDTLSMGVDGYDGSDTNSDLIIRWMADTRTTLGRMIHGVDGGAEGVEYSLLCDAEERVMTALKAEAIALAVAVEAHRAHRDAA
jgi:hypothetical protein